MTLVLVAGAAGLFFLLLSLFMLVRLRSTERLLSERLNTIARERRQSAAPAGRLTKPPPASAWSSVDARGNDDVTTSALGYLAGGSLAGTLVGDAMANAAGSSVNEPACDPSSHTDDSDTTRWSDSGGSCDAESPSSD
ncbi:hypothetical protein [Xanthomonas hortorum]|uniref:Secreted protein n=1 Tax=Xanthomonas hortorum pv. vitians TaxID=83224 RepID=A0AAW8ZS34_9XANT|nr:hypothetical protein [Xanthomonas hortorum]MDV7248914.1 hypothetical protein [Xanthomonas hortorum pv. vitians]